MILANQAVSIVSSLIIKGGESLAEKYGEKIAESLSEKTNNLFSIIKRKFDGNEDDKLDLENFQRKPERYSGQITEILKDKMKSDNAFASNIDTAIKEIQDLNVDVDIEDSHAKNITGLESNRDKGSFSATIKGSTAEEDIVGGKFNV